METEPKVTAKYDSNTKRFFKYIIESNDYGIAGTIYISKEEDVPDSIAIGLRTN